MLLSVHRVLSHAHLSGYQLILHSMEREAANLLSALHVIKDLNVWSPARHSSGLLMPGQYIRGSFKLPKHLLQVATRCTCFSKIQLCVLCVHY